MEITGNLISVLPLQQGVSQSGNAWQKLTIIIQTGDKYPKKVAINLIGDKIGQFSTLLQPNALLKVSFDISSRDYTGKDGVTRWSTDVNAYKVEPAVAAAPAAAAVPAPFAAPAPFSAPSAPAPAQAAPAPFQSGVPSAAPGVPAGFNAPAPMQAGVPVGDGQGNLPF